jgi:hypothetical protein
LVEVFEFKPRALNQGYLKLTKARFGKFKTKFESFLKSETNLRL